MPARGGPKPSTAKRTKLAKAKKSTRPASRGARPNPRPRPSKRATLARRRARALLIGSAIFAAVVIVTSLPVSNLLTQHNQLSATSHELNRVTNEDKALQQEERQLSDPATIATIARRDYGLVAPGSQAYEILPAPGSSPGAAVSSGHVPLDGPLVVPGSVQSQELLGAGALSVSGATGPGGSGPGGSGDSRSARGRGASQSVGGSPSSTGGFWTRVLHTLEFWR